MLNHWEKCMSRFFPIRSSEMGRHYEAVSLLVGKEKGRGYLNPYLYALLEVFCVNSTTLVEHVT